MLGGVLHAFFRLFWPMSLLSSRWACEFEPQVLAWVGCSKPSCFTRFGAGSGCGGLAGERAWGALGASPGALGGLWAVWGPLGGGVWELLGSLGASGGLWVARRVPQARPQRRFWRVSGGLWGPLGAAVGLWGPLGAAVGLWGPLGAAGGTTATRGHQEGQKTNKQTNKQQTKGSTNKRANKQTSKQTNEQTNKQASKQVYNTVVNIRRFSLVHYKKVVNIQRFSVSPLGF